MLEEIREATRALALELGVSGLMNVQFAVRGETVYIIEVNPRASRTVPFVSKAIGRPLAKIATKVMAGKTLAELGFTEEIVPKHVAVKESVFPFAKLPGVDTILGPEMRSTGEVMGIGDDVPGSVRQGHARERHAHARARLRVHQRARRGQGRRVRARRAARQARFTLIATDGTARVLAAAGVACERVNKVLQGSPHSVDMIKQGRIDMVINTTSDAQAIRDSYSIRRQTLMSGIAYFTTMAAASAAVAAIEARGQRGTRFGVRTLQEYHLTTK